MTDTMPQTCARCSADLSKTGFTMSMFNMDYICPECKQREREHPKYNEAREAEQAAEFDEKGRLRRNPDGTPVCFPGIGCPEELYLNRSETK